MYDAVQKCGCIDLCGITDWLQQRGALSSVPPTQSTAANANRRIDTLFYFSAPPP